MGEPWIYNGAEWRDGIPYVYTTTGWRPAMFIYRHNGTIWEQVWTRDNTPPSVVVTAALKSGTDKDINITVSASGGPLRRVVVKVTTGSTWPSSPENSSGYIAGFVSGRAWSEWIAVDSMVSSLSSTTRTIPVSGVISTSYSTKYNISVWAQDEAFNWSAVKTATVTTKAATPPPKVLKSFEGIFSSSTSKTYSATLSTWPSDTSNYVYQGSTRGYEGLWFYGSQFAGWLNGANAITQMRLQIQRLNTVHGAAGDSLPFFRAHGYASQPTGNPAMSGSFDAPTGIQRGERRTYTIPSTWYPSFLSGVNKGFGIVWEATGLSTRYLICYGAGTTSGRVYLDYNKYV